MDGMQWMTKMSLHASTFSLHSTGYCCNCLPLHWTMKVPLQSPPDPVFTCIGRQALTHWGFQTCGLPSHGLASQSKPLPVVCLLLHANSYKEPHVRAGCQVGTKDGQTTTRVWHVPLSEVLLLSNTPHVDRQTWVCICMYMSYYVCMHVWRQTCMGIYMFMYVHKYTYYEQTCACTCKGFSFCFIYINCTKVV